jgi:hypothetical protein
MNKLTKFNFNRNQQYMVGMRRRRYTQRRHRKRNKPGLYENTFKTDIRLTTYSYDLGSATGFPLLLRLGVFLSDSTRIQQLCTLFQQYKMVKVHVSITPEIKDGTTPFILYMLTSMDRSVDTTQELVLTKGVKCSNKNVTNKTIMTKGRQNDFNYWYDCKNINVVDQRPTMQFAFAPDSYGRVPTGSYVIAITATLMFRYPQSVVPPAAKIGGKIDECKIKEEEDEKEEDLKGEQEKKEDEEEGKKMDKDAWNLTGEDDDLAYENEKLEMELEKLKEELKALKLSLSIKEKDN